MPAGVSFGPFTLDEQGHALWRGAERIHIAPKCFALLHYLVERPGRLVTKDEILEAVWPETHVVDGVLKVRMQELRAALGEDANHPRLIETVHRRGYRFIGRVTAGPERAAEPPADATPALELAGRDAELAALCRCYELASGGRRQIVFVSGEAGIGKTALADLFAARLPLDALVGHGQCLEHYGSGEAYLPVLDALGQLTRGARRDELVAALRALAPTWLVQLPWLVTAADRDVLQRELQGATRERMLREMADLLESLTRSCPLVLVIEDLHWSDPSTLDLLALVAHRRQPARLMIVATYRPVDVILSGHPLKGLKSRLEQQRLATEIRLPFLSAEHVRTFLARRLATADVPEELVAHVLDRTAGNPLFVVSLVDHLIERGWLVRRDGWTLQVPVERIRAEVPEGLRQMIERQLEQLGEDDGAVLEAASVVGEEFTAATVAAALEQDRGSVEARCHAVANRGQFLRAHGVASLPEGEITGRFAFVHALHRDVLYRHLAAARRVSLHRRVGAWQERMAASPAEIARHYREAAHAGCADRAVAFALKAAERARGMRAWAEAARHYRAALDVWPLQTERAERERCATLVALGRAEERSGQFADGRATLVEAAAVARREGLSGLFAQAALGVGFHLVTEPDVEQIARLEEALDRLEPRDSSLRACVLARLDAALSPLPRTHARRDALRREALAVARRLGDPETLLRVLQYVRWGFIGWERANELRALAAELHDVAVRAADEEQALHARLLRVAMLGELGAGETRAALDELEAAAEDAGIPWFRWFAVRIRAVHALQSGCFAAAERAMQDARHAGARMDHPNVRPVFGAQMIGLHLLQGRHAEIEQRLAGHVDRATGDVASRALLALARLRAGDVAGARAFFESVAADGFAGIPREATWLMTLAHLAEVCAGLGDRRRAPLIHELLAPHAGRMIGVGPSITSLGHGSRYLGILAACCGRWDEAERRLAEAARTHARTGARPWLAYTLRDQARVASHRPADGRGRGERRKAVERLCERSLAIARELGMAGLERELLSVA